jgi:spermidine/putrescine transport system substrate-binding protein
MKRLIKSLAGVLALMIPVCFAIAEQKKNELNIFIWSEYIDPEIVTSFEKEFNAKVTIDLYEESESMVAKLAAGGASQYDIVVPPDYTVPGMVARGLIRPIDRTQVPNFKNLKEKFLNPGFDPGNKFTVPYQWGTTGIYVRKQPGKEIDKTWGLFFDPAKQPGPFLFVDGMRESINAALLYLKYPVNSTDKAQLLEAMKLLQETKKRSRGLVTGAGGKNKVLSKEVTMAVAYNGDALRGVAEDPETVYFIPREGAEIWIDSLAIPAGAPHPEMAHKFINYILDPKVGAQLSNFNQYATPNAASMEFINAEDKANELIYPNEETMKKLHLNVDLGSATKLYDEIWTRVRAG